MDPVANHGEFHFDVPIGIGMVSMAGSVEPLTDRLGGNPPHSRFFGNELVPRTTDEFVAGQRVAVTQQIPQRERVWVTRFEGTVVDYAQKVTGAWFAHSKDDRLWLDRLTVQKDDGERVVCHLDCYSRVEVLADVQAPEGAPPVVVEGGDIPAGDDA